MARERLTCSWRRNCIHGGWGSISLGFLDDDQGKQNTSLNGVPILGHERDALRLVTRLEKNQKPISEIIIAMSPRRTVAVRCGRRDRQLSRGWRSL